MAQAYRARLAEKMRDNHVVRTVEYLRIVREDRQAKNAERRYPDQRQDSGSVDNPDTGVQGRRQTEPQPRATVANVCTQGQ